MPAYGKTTDEKLVLHGPARIFVHDRFTTAQLAETYLRISGAGRTKIDAGTALDEVAATWAAPGTDYGVAAALGASISDFFPEKVDHIMDISDDPPEDPRFYFHDLVLAATGPTGAAPTGSVTQGILTPAAGEKLSFWRDIGATDGGTTLVIRRPTSEIRVDHELIGIDAEPAEASISTTMAEQTWENLKIAFSEDSNVTPPSANNDEYLDFSLDGDLQERMFAVVQRHRAQRKYTAWFFHTVQIEGSDVSIPMVPGGGLSNIPVTLRVFRRTNLSPPIFRVIRQALG